MTVTSFLNVTNKIYKGGTLAKRLYKGSTPIYRAYKGSTLIYEMWKTYLTSDTEFAIEATAQSPSSFIDVYSYGVDYDNEQHDLEYTFSPDSISKNTSSSAKTHTVTINQTRTSQKITATVTQEGNKLDSVSYSTPTVVSILVDSVPASGGTAYAYVNYQQTKTTHYTNGDKVNETLQGQIAATILGGTKGEGTTTLTNGAIKVESAYDDVYSSSRLVYTVSKIGFTINGKYKESSAEAKIYQDANTKNTSITYTLTATPLNTTINAAKQNVSIDIVSTRVEYYSYSSGYSNNSGTLQTNWTASTSTGTLTATSGTQSSTIDLQAPANQSTTATVSYKVTVSNAGKTVSFTVTQSKDAIASSGTVVNRVANTPQAETALADGTDADVAMSAVVTRRTVYISGRQVDSTSTEAVVISSMKNGSTTITGATVAANHLGTTPYDRRVIATITSISGTVVSGSVTWTGTLNVYQEANARSSSPTSYGAWNVSCVNNASTNIANTGGTMSVNVNSYRTNTYTWTSGSTDTSTEFGSGAVSGSNVTGLPTTFTGKSGGTTINGTVAENLGAARTCTISITSNSITKSASRTQNAVAYTFTTSTSSSIDCNATQSTVNIVVTSTRNGKVWGITKSNVSVSNSSIATVGTVTSSSSTYTIPITMAANTGAERSVTVTVTQPGSGSTKTFTINQYAGKVREVATIAIYEIVYTKSNMSQVRYDVTVSATDTANYSGGSVGSVKLYIRSYDGDNVANRTLASSLTVAEGTESSHYTGTFNIGSAYRGNVYLEGYLNDKLVVTSDIELIE